MRSVTSTSYSSKAILVIAKTNKDSTCYVLLFPCPDVLINVPDELDLSHLRGRGLQPGEEELQEGGPPSDQGPPPPGIHSIQYFIIMLHASVVVM